MNWGNECLKPVVGEFARVGKIDGAITHHFDAELVAPSIA